MDESLEFRVRGFGFGLEASQFPMFQVLLDAIKGSRAMRLATIEAHAAFLAPFVRLEQRTLNPTLPMNLDTLSPPQTSSARDGQMLKQARAYTTH